jgi:hypothetical protein
MEDDKVKKEKKACGTTCPSPTICKDLFKGKCAVEIMQQQKGEAEKVKDKKKPGTYG